MNGTNILFVRTWERPVERWHGETQKGDLFEDPKLVFTREVVVYELYASLHKARTPKTCRRCGRSIDKGDLYADVWFMEDRWFEVKKPRSRGSIPIGIPNERFLGYWHPECAIRYFLEEC